MNKNKKNKEIKKIFKNLNVRESVSKAKEKFLEKLNMPDDLTYNLTKVTMLENKEIYIEGKNNIADYSDTYIKVQMNNLYLIVDGRKLNIDEITDYDLLISGDISNIEYIKR